MARHGLAAPNTFPYWLLCGRGKAHTNLRLVDRIRSVDYVEYTVQWTTDTAEETDSQSDSTSDSE